MLICDRPKTVDVSSQLWTTRYAPQKLKDICGNKGQVEKLQQWLRDWWDTHLQIPILTSLTLHLCLQAAEPQMRLQETREERHEHLPRSSDNRITWNREDDHRTFVCNS